jgi:hypothetical protein
MAWVEDATGKPVCGNCQYHKKRLDGKYMCKCEYSPNEGCVTRYTEQCREFYPRGGYKWESKRSTSER